jgi:hypothetical protein
MDDLVLSPGPIFQKRIAKSDKVKLLPGVEPIKMELVLSRSMRSADED